MPMRPAPLSLALFAATALVMTAPAAAQQRQAPPAPGAQQQQPPQAQQQAPQAQQQAPAPPKAYKPLAITTPKPMADPSFEAFRKQLAEVVQKKDRAALGKLVVAKGFFWDAEAGDKADKNKPGVDTLVTALRLDAPQGSGWDMLAGHAEDDTAAPNRQHKGAVCAPAEPTFDGKQLEALVKATGTDPSEWGYPSKPGLEVRASAQPNAPVVEKLGMTLVRIMPEEAPPAQGQQSSPMLRVVAPSGKVGFVSGEDIAPLGNEQLCYIKQGNNWLITGYIGNGDQQ
jgi:hypothetical protein